MPSHIKSSMLGTRLYCRYIKGVFRPAPGKASGGGTSHPRRIASHHRDTTRGEKMTISELLQYCMAKPGAEQACITTGKRRRSKWKMYCLRCERSRKSPSCFAENQPGAGGVLRQQHSDVRPSRHLNKAHWAPCISTVRCQIRKSIIWWMRLSAGGEFAAGRKT